MSEQIEQSDCEPDTPLALSFAFNLKIWAISIAFSFYAVFRALWRNWKNSLLIMRLLSSTRASDLLTPRGASLQRWPDLQSRSFRSSCNDFSLQAFAFFLSELKINCSNLVAKALLTGTSTYRYHYITVSCTKTKQNWNRLKIHQHWTMEKDLAIERCMTYRYITSSLTNLEIILKSQFL